MKSRGDYRKIASAIPRCAYYELGCRAFPNEEASMATLYDFEMESITGTPVPLSTYQDQVSLVVNVATK